MEHGAQRQLGDCIPTAVRLHVPAPGVGLGRLPPRRNLRVAQLIRDLPVPTKARWRW
jgi:hypothetical protein